MAETIVPETRTKSKLRDGSLVVGTMLIEIRQPSVMQLLAQAGFDFVIIDSEHGPFAVESIADLSRMARAHGLTPIVRVPDLTYKDITQALDGGAQGIMTPRITGPDQVERVVQIMKYPPMGIRGSVVGRGHTDFKAGPVSDMMRDANNQTMLVIQIETKEALTNLNDILSVEGVDVALVGPNDLSIALGIPGQFDSPVFREALETTIAACKKHNVVPGIHMNELPRAIEWAKQGMRLVSMGSEAGMILRSGRETTSSIRSAVTK